MPWPTSDLEKLFFVVRSQVGTTETPKNSNRGPKVEAYQRATGNKPGEAWCGSCLVWCFDYAELTWPFARSGSVATVVADAKRLGKIVPAKMAQPGDLLALWFPKLKRHAHICVLTEKVGPERWATIDGNTDDDGGREGWGFFERTGERARQIGPNDVVLRWRS